MNMIKSLGLTAEEAKTRLASSGPNHLLTATPVCVWAIAFKELKEPMILLLIVVGLFYGMWGSIGDTIAIFVVTFLLVAIDVGSEFRMPRLL
jgi:P-type Ca2+ transporter type 2C